MNNYPVTIQIVMADDHEIFRDGFAILFRRVPDIVLVGSAADGRSLMQLVEVKKPDVVLVDIEMPEMDGIEVTKLIRERFPQIGVIALSSYDNDVLVIDTIKAGAQGYLLKNASKREILEAIRAVHQQENYYSPHIAQRLTRFIATSRFDPHNPLASEIRFSEREQEIMRLICSELSNRDISEKLFLSIRTIEGYRLRIMEKAGVRTVAGLVVFAIRRGIFKL
jgi:DNA-binding NarL/FixJ family response regulator